MAPSLQQLAGETQARILALLRRSDQTIGTLAASLGLTDNAVRLHVTALARDGFIQDAGTKRDTGGKPARVYALSRQGEELFPKAYATVLAALIERIAREEGRGRAVQLLRAVGAELAPQTAGAASRQAGDQSAGAESAEAAAAAIRALGGDVEVLRVGSGWKLQGYGCPLSSVTAEHPEACVLATALIEGVTGKTVSERCERSQRPRCAFFIEG